MSTTRVQTLPALTRSWAFVQLAKPDVTFLVVLTTLAGFQLGAQGSVKLFRLTHAVVATLLLAAGTSALNQYVEREEDARMRRTARRPIPSGALQPSEALAFGVTFCLLGAVYLLAFSGPLAALIGMLVTASYLGAYTPLKKRTPWATFVGAFPGAAPPLIGWAAAQETLSTGAWTLFLILFLWQFPHFLAIAWMYREDYSRAGVRMISTQDPAGKLTFGQIVAYSAALIPASLLPSVLGLAGVNYFFGALVLGLAMLQVSLWAAATKSNLRAKWLMHATVLYIPLLFGLLLLDKV
jgi:protoheme IX farnesyltransferase